MDLVIMITREAQGGIAQHGTALKSTSRVLGSKRIEAQKMLQVFSGICGRCPEASLQQINNDSNTTNMSLLHETYYQGAQ